MAHRSHVALIISTLFLLTAAYSEAKVLVGVVDSGVDFRHELLKSTQFVNEAEQLNKKDDDKNGYVDDFSGWNLAANDNKVFDEKDVSKRKKRYDAAVTVMNMLGRVEKGEQLSALEKAKLVALIAFVISDLNNINTMMHGSHVAGIIARENDKVELLGVKLGFGDGKTAPKYGIPSKEELEKFLSEMAKGEKEFFSELVSFLKTQQLRVANASWGVSEALVAQSITAQYPNIPAENAAEMANYYLAKVEGLYASMPDSLPNTLFALAAGNDGADNDKKIFLPANVKRDNTITVAAVDDKGAMAGFSNYGVGHVDIAAPGVAVLSSVPDNRYVLMSGTSMASPYVARVASLVIAENEKLTPAEAKKIMMDTVDKKDYLKRVVKSSGIINEKRAVIAAKESNHMDLNEAIAAAFELIPRVDGKVSPTQHTMNAKLSLNGFSAKEIVVIIDFYYRMIRAF